MRLDLRGVHCIEALGEHIVLDVESNSIHRFDEASMKILSSLIDKDGDIASVRKEADDQARDILDEILELYEAGLLFTPPLESLSLTMPDEVKSLCLNVAHDCNLACAYCFAAQGNFGGQPILMDPETGRKAVDFLLAHSKDRQMLEIDFFGGEPLMAWDTVKEVIKYAKEKLGAAGKVIKFSMTTNGVTLDEEKIDFLVAENVGMVLSLDGRKEVNDRMRYTKNHQPSYDLVVPHFKYVSEQTEDYVVRGTYTRHNLDFSQDLVLFSDLGFDHLSIEPVVCERATDFALKEGDLPRIAEEYEQLASICIDRYQKGDPLDFFHFNINLEGGPCIYKRIVACGAGYEYLAITPEGDIYPCHQFVGQAEWKMGTLDQGILNQDIKETFSANTIYAKEDCKACWARYYCSGGCHANAYAFNKNIKKPYKIGCEIQKIRLEMAILVQVMVLLHDKKNDEQNKLLKNRNDVYNKDKINRLLKR